VETTEVSMSGQLALELVDERLAPAAVWETLPAAVWETLPPAVRAKVTVMLARLFAAMVEEARDE
jgi:hypothetical protein